MIESVKTAIDLTYTVFQYSLYVSFKIGHFLVNTIGFLQKLCTKLAYLLVEVLGAVLESFATFFQDVIQSLQSILRTVSSVDVEAYLSEFINLLVVIMGTLSDFVIGIVLSVVSGIQTVLLSPKYLLLYVIANIWSITSGVYHFSTFFFGSIHFLSLKVKDLIIAGTLLCTNLPKMIYVFLSDIPVESTICIAISCCLIYLFACFYTIVFSFLYRQIKRLFWNIWQRYIGLRRYFTRNIRSERAVYRRQVLPNRRPRINTVRNSLNVSKSEDNDRYCVICQEHIKCILLLPCRHLCMCNECIHTLQLYHDTCPICRTNIERTMQIFV